MKKTILTAIAAGMLCIVPMTGIYAADSKPAIASTQNVISLGQHHKLTSAEIAWMKSHATKAPQRSYQTITPASLTQSADYQYNLNGLDSYDSPEFYHSSGQILVTLVQWSNNFLGTSDLYWSVVDPNTGTPVVTREVTGNYTSTNYTINFGTINPGYYTIRVASMEASDSDSGNFYFYY